MAGEGATTQEVGATAQARLSCSKTARAPCFLAMILMLSAGVGGRADLPGNSLLKQQAASPMGQKFTSFSFSAFGLKAG